MDTRDRREFKLRYVGKRFEGARLPLDVITDLPAFRNLLVAFAKSIWRIENDGRTRLPKGFEQALSFDLVALENGSAVPCLSRNREFEQAPLPTIPDYFDTIMDSAYARLVDLMDEGLSGTHPLEELDVASARALDRFGSSLREGERIEFVGSTGRDGNIVSITPARRRDFLKRVKGTYTLRIEGIGYLTGLNTESGWIEIQTLNYGDLHLPLDGDEVHRFFDGNTRQRVRFDLSASIDREDKVRSVTDVYNVSMVDEEVDRAIEQAEERLVQLRNLGHGWNNGEGEVITERSVANSHQLIARRSNLVNLFRIYPTLEGGVQIEFEFGNWELSVEMMADGKIEFYGSNTDSSEDFGPISHDELHEDFFTDLDKYTVKSSILETSS